MRCPVCGTNGIEGGICFYCEARKKRKKKTTESGPGEAPDGASKENEALRDHKE